MENNMTCNMLQDIVLPCRDVTHSRGLELVQPRFRKRAKELLLRKSTFNKRCFLRIYS